MILAVNTSFPEINHLAAELADADLLSKYVRPYASLQRPWERFLAQLPGVGSFYNRSFGRRKLPEPLSAEHINEAGVAIDFLMAAHALLPASIPGYQSVRRKMLDRRTHIVGLQAARVLKDEDAVVASWGCADRVFRAAKERGALCILNYPLAHHRFARRYLNEEAELQPAFASTLNTHDRPDWYIQVLDEEIELADHILVGSSFARDSFIAEGIPGEKLTVLPYGADVHLFQPAETPKPPSDNLKLLFVGQIGQRKGISYLLDAVRRMDRKGDTLTLVGQFQGDGVAFENSQPLFHHIPHVPHTVLREIYRQADVFVFPTLVEGLGIVVLEAMASGLPVITTPNGPGDIVRDGVDGYLVPPRDVNAIIDRLERLRADPDLRAEMGRNARQRAQEYTWDAYRQAGLSAIKEWSNLSRTNMAVPGYTDGG